MTHQPVSDSASAPVVTSSDATAHAFMAGGGEMGEMMRSFDWSQTPVGDTVTWPSSLRTALSIMLSSSHPMFVWWGEKTLTNFYNDAYIGILGRKHPEALGKSAIKIWSEIWTDIEPLVKNVYKTGKPVYMKNLRLLLDRHGYEEETYFTFSYSPLKNDLGEVAGIFCTVTETTDEVLTRQRLEESEERFRNLADTAPMYIAMADESGNAVYFNKPWLTFTGKKLQDMKGLGWLSTLHPEDAPKFEKDFKYAFSKRIQIREEYRFKRADGEYRWMLAVGAPRFTPDGHFSGYFGTYTDFHDLKQAQLALQQSEERFRTLIDKSADAVQLVTPEGKILYSSDSTKNVLGYAPEEFADKGVTPFLHPDDRDYFFKHFNDLIAHPNKQIVMQYRAKHKDGSWAWIETVGVNRLQTPNIHALVGNFRNITKQKEAEDRLRDSEERFRALAENIPNLAWMADGSGVIYWYNNRWYEYTGTTEAQMLGKGWRSVHDPRFLPKVLRKWKRSIKTGQSFEMVFPMRGADGIFRPFLTRAVPLASEKGMITQWVGTSTDISEQLQKERAVARSEELEKIADQLAKQQKELLELNQAKDEFISIASHQLRTPATGVKQYLGMLLEGYAEPLADQQRSFMERAYESNERELEIINDLLQVAQVDAGKIHIKKSKTDFVALLRSILDEQSEKFASRNQAVSFDPPAPKLYAAADRNRMRMVLDNLVDNASKYTLPDKKITIKVSVYRKTKLRIDVCDQGVGIEAKDCAKIFDKFVRVDNPLSTTIGGSGLGLYLVKRIVDLHDGTIQVSSKPSEGSRFTVLLPLK
jgi:PAS domain S-box-containing protein